MFKNNLLNSKIYMVIIMNLSKSRYTLGIRCLKLLWLSLYKPDEVTDSLNENVLKNGNEVGELARGLFGDYKLIDFDLGFESMIEETKKSIGLYSVICEASFNYEGNFASVDILRCLDDGVEIYEVKSSTNIIDLYIDDISYQTWVLKKCGINVINSYIVYVNNNYVFDGKLDIYKYFVIKRVNELIDLDKVEKNIKLFKKTINSNVEPSCNLNICCHDPYDCNYFDYCINELPKPCVFDVGWRLSFNKKLKLYNDGIISYNDLINCGSLNDKQRRQIEFYLYDKKPYINKEVIINFMSSLKYPLFFLDFESYQCVIPNIKGTSPYQQICFQYSLHYYLEEDGKLYHKEYLSDNYLGDSMRGLCEQLCKDIPLDSCVLVYNDSFEKTRLKEMASLYLDLSSHLLNIRDNIIDLMPIFSNHDYYVKDMGGSFSIKYVLPSLFPDDESLNYHNLEQVHKGTEATEAYLLLKDLCKDEELKLRKNMLKYCELDTYAMVKIFDKLKDIK